MPNNAANAMPHSHEAEQSLLGCVMLDAELQTEILSGLVESDFYSEAHRKIFKAMTEIVKSNRTADLVTLADYMDKTAELKEAGGMKYLADLASAAPSAANYRSYLEIVRLNGILRRLIRASQNIIENSRAAQDRNSAVAFAEKQIYDVSAEMDSSTLVRVSDTLPEVIERFDRIARDSNAYRGLTTGYTKFDEMTNGLQKGDLILLAARPSYGKSSLAMNIVERVATNAHAVCAVFSLEMPKTQIAQRLVCSLASVSMEKALKGKLDGDEWKRLLAAQDKLSAAKIFVDDSSVITPEQMMSKCRRLKSRYGLDFVMVDYIQLMNNDRNKRDRDNRQQEVSDISRSLKILAKEIDVPVLALSQLSRAVESRPGMKPQLSDLRESGAIEQDADIVLFIHRPDKAVTDKDIQSGKKIVENMAEILIAKHRNGPTGSFPLFFKSECTKFVNPPKVDVQEPYAPHSEKREEIADAVAAEYADAGEDGPTDGGAEPQEERSPFEVPFGEMPSSRGADPEPEPDDGYGEEDDAPWNEDEEPDEDDGEEKSEGGPADGEEN